jgi:hypothetical protein
LGLFAVTPQATRHNNDRDAIIPKAYLMVLPSVQRAIE